MKKSELKQIIKEEIQKLLVEASNKPPKKLYVTNHLTNTASKFPQNLLYIHYLGSSNDSSFLAYNKKVVKPNVSGEELEYELNTAAMEKLGFIIQRPLHSGIEAWDIIVPDKYVIRKGGSGYIKDASKFVSQIYVNMPAVALVYGDYDEGKMIKDFNQKTFETRFGKSKMNMNYMGELTAGSKFI